jgi:hypothetical protein
MTADDRAKGSRGGGPRGGDRRGRQPSRGGGSRADRPRRDAPGGDGRDDERSLTTRGPIGIEGATRTPGAPPRRPERPDAAPERPEIPADAEVTLPKAVVRELRRSVRRPQDAEEAALALSIASQRLEEREGAEVLDHLAWAKHLAPRSPAVREALGVALYLAEDYAGALSELQAYRRFTSRADQNHLVADCLRALGRNTERIPDLVDAMSSDEVPAERRIEGHIVWASMLADDGDVGAGRSVLRRTIAEHDPGDEPEVAHLRLWYVAGDLAERAGDRADARRHFARIAGVTGR